MIESHNLYIRRVNSYHGLPVSGAIHYYYIGSLIMRDRRTDGQTHFITALVGQLVYNV